MGFASFIISKSIKYSIFMAARKAQKLSWQVAAVSGVMQAPYIFLLSN
jgi:hypothetical protein